MTTLAMARLPAGSPLWLFALVLGLLILHIAAASLGIISGYTAVFARKGGRLHRRAGLLFVVAMVTMGVAAVFLAFWIHQRGNVAGGALAAYLVATGWMTVRREPGRVGRFETGALLLVLAMGGAMAAFGVEAQASPSHRLDGYPPAPYFGFTIIAACFAAGDLRMIRRGGVAGAQRLSRHILRMGLAFFVAASFFFIGRQKIMPAALHGSPILLLLGLAPLGLTIFWLVRVRFFGGLGRVPKAPALARATP
jgi:uncharacterized membrane protein